MSPDRRNVQLPLSLHRWIKTWGAARDLHIQDVIQLAVVRMCGPLPASKPDPDPRQLTLTPDSKQGGV